MQTTESTSQNRANTDTALLVLRIALGVIFMAHGSQKLFGAFGGPGLQGTVQFLGQIGYLVAIGEFFGGLGILLGFLSRFSAAAIMVIMLGAIQKVHWANGFFAPKGFEFNFSLIGIALAILIAGPGRFTIASLFPEKIRKYIV